MGDCMAYAMFTDSANGTHDVILRREGRNQIMVTTEVPLTDDQMRDLYWVVLYFEKTGKTMKDLVKVNERIIEESGRVNKW